MTNSYSIYLVPFTHMDLFWLGEREECLSRGGRAIAAALAILREHPEFRFLLEDMVFVAEYLANHPEQEDELRAHVQAGRIEVGPKWTGIYQNLQLGEDLVRNLLYGFQYVRAHFGVDPVTVHLGDLPGYTPQYPQIAAKAGIENVVITRGGPRDQVLYYWAAPDGSRVLTWNAIKGYWWSRNARLHTDVSEALGKGLVEEAQQVMALTPAPILMHWGVDLIVPPASLVGSVAAWNAATDLPMRFATPTEYFQAAVATARIPTLCGEIPSLWPYTEAAFPHICALNVPAVHRLVAGENWCELARRLGFACHLDALLRDAWLKLLQGMDHNFQGTGAIAGNQRKREFHIAAILAGEEATRTATRQIAENVRLPDVAGITPIVVFNSTSWERTELATAHISFYGEVEAFHMPGSEFGDPFRHLRLCDHTGRRVPFQYLEQKTVITREATLCFRAEDVPAFGYRLYYLQPATDDEPVEPCCTISGTDWNQTLVVESQRFRLTVDRPSGNQALFDKVLDRQVAGPMNLSAEEERLDKNWFRDETTGRTFPNLVERIDVVENGSVRARIIVEGRIGNICTRQEWLLYREADYVDLVDTLIWEGPSPLVRVQRVMATGIEAPEVVYGVAFGANTWQNHQPNIEPKFADEIGAESWHRIREVQNWVDLGGPNHGLTVASDHRAVELNAGTLRINLIRSGGWRDAYDEVPYGSNRFSIRTRLLPHQGDWKESAAYRAGWALNLPLISMTVNDPLSPKRLEPVASLCQSPARNVLITTIKRAEDTSGTVVRGYEVEGRRATGVPSIAGDVRTIREVNLLEEQPRVVGEVVWHPNEIKTLKLE